MLLAGNSIFVEATLNGRTGIFLLDTGSPWLMVNKAYFTGAPIHHSDESLTDLNGNIIKPEYFTVKSLSLQGLALPRPAGYMLDLTGIEKAKGLPVLGVLGYSVFRQLELVFDFEKRQLVIFSLKKNGLPDCETYPYCPVDSLDLKISGHFPSVEAKLGGKILRLGIDSGSEVNLLHPKALKKQEALFQASSQVWVKGFSHELESKTTGWVHEFSLGSLEAQPLEVTLTNFSHLNKALPTDLDGILGTCFLMRGKMAINFKRKKLYFWETAGETLARSGQK